MKNLTTLKPVLLNRKIRPSKYDNAKSIKKQAKSICKTICQSDYTFSISFGQIVAFDMYSFFVSAFFEMQKNYLSIFCVPLQPN